LSAPYDKALIPTELKVGAASLDNEARIFRSAGICFDIGPLHCRVRSDINELLAPLKILYQDFRIHFGASKNSVPDFDIEIVKIKSGAWLNSAVEFRWKGYPPLPALPVSQAHPLFEWGLNWSMATLFGTEIVIHAAIVERNGFAIVLPGEPGAGKSTLCAALVLSGWRLLSDELTIISIDSGLALPLPRPISLKDESIDLIASRYPAAQLTVPVMETRKGMIAYVRPPSAAIKRWNERIPIRYVLFPKFQKDGDISVEPVSQAACLARLMANTFNVGLLGHVGFSALANVVAGTQANDLIYGNLDMALEWIARNCP
jgi:HprK-related kinase A